MLFNILKLLGLDVPAKIAAAKSEIEQRVEEVTSYAKQVTQTAGVIAALSAVASLLLTVAAGVGLFALHRVIAEQYGVNIGLGVVAGVLIAAALILLLAARSKAHSRSNLRILRQSSSSTFTLSPPLETMATSPAAAPAVARPLPEAFAAESNESAGDLFESLAFVFAKYLKFPVFGNPVLDELVGNLRTTARGNHRGGNAAGGQTSSSRRSGPASHHAGRRCYCRVVAGAAKSRRTVARHHAGRVGRGRIAIPICCRLNRDMRRREPQCRNRASDGAGYTTGRKQRPLGARRHDGEAQSLGE